MQAKLRKISGTTKLADAIRYALNRMPKARGYLAWPSRPASWRQRTDTVLLAHIRDQFRLSLGNNGRPRMTEELKELSFDVGHRRVGRLMQENGIEVKRNKKFKATTAQGCI